MSRGHDLEDLPLGLSSGNNPPPLFVSSPTTNLERAFASFHRANPHVYRHIESKALGAIESGRRRIGLRRILEELRDELAVNPIGDDFKVNNSHAPFYARLLLHNRPEIGAFMETRRQIHLSRPSQR